MLSKLAPLSILLGSSYAVSFQSGMPKFDYLVKSSHTDIQGDIQGNIFMCDNSYKLYKWNNNAGEREEVKDAP